MMSDDEKPDNVVSLTFGSAPLPDEDPMNLTCPDCTNVYWLINTEGVIKCSYCEWELPDMEDVEHE